MPMSRNGLCGMASGGILLAQKGGLLEGNRISCRQMQLLAVSCSLYDWMWKPRIIQWKHCQMVSVGGSAANQRTKELMARDDS